MRVENGNAAGVANSGSSGSLQQVSNDRRISNQESDGSGSDSVQLSGASSLVALARTVNGSDRQSRLGSLASQVQSGQYRVDSQRVSEAILESLA